MFRWWWGQGGDWGRLREGIGSVGEWWEEARGRESVELLFASSTPIAKLFCRDFFFFPGGQLSFYTRLTHPPKCVVTGVGRMTCSSAVAAPMTASATTRTATFFFRILSGPKKFRKKIPQEECVTISFKRPTTALSAVLCSQSPASALYCAALAAGSAPAAMAPSAAFIARVPCSDGALKKIGLDRRLVFEMER
jgi:hypothetical protein